MTSEELMNGFIDVIAKAVYAKIEARIETQLEAAIKTGIDGIDLKFKIESALNDLEITDFKRTLIENVVEEHLNNYDPTDHQSFESSVEHVIDNYAFGEIVRDVLNDGSFDITFRS